MNILKREKVDNLESISDAKEKHGMRYTPY